MFLVSLPQQPNKLKPTAKNLEFRRAQVRKRCRTSQYISHLKGWKFWDSSSESQTERPALSECTAPRVSLLHVFPLLVEDGRDVFDFGDPWDFVGRRHAGHCPQPRLLLHFRQFAVVSCRTVFLVVDGDAASGCLLGCRRGRRC